MFPKDIRILDQLFGKVLILQNGGVNPGNQNLFVIGSVEDADVSPIGEPKRRAPEKIVLQLIAARFNECVDGDPVGVDPRHDRADGAILAGGVHGLKNQKHAVTPVCVHHSLQVVEIVLEISELVLVVGLVGVEVPDLRRMLLDVKLALPVYKEGIDVERRFLTHASDSVYKSPGSWKG